jgi:hypothetical protein
LGGSSGNYWPFSIEHAVASRASVPSGSTCGHRRYGNYQTGSYDGGVCRRSFAERARNGSTVIGIDLGGTNTKAAILSPEGTFQSRSVVPTPAEGRAPLLRHLLDIATLKLNEAQIAGIPAKALAIATAGWVVPDRGEIVYATEIFPMDGHTLGRGTRTRPETSCSDRAYHDTVHR